MQTFWSTSPLAAGQISSPFLPPGAGDGGISSSVLRLVVARDTGVAAANQDLILEVRQGSNVLLRDYFSGSVSEARFQVNPADGPVTVANVSGVDASCVSITDLDARG